MTIPKSEKLAKEDDQQEPAEVKVPASIVEATEEPIGPLQIRKIECMNDFVAILQATSHSAIMVPEESKYKNEGVVVGVGPGTSDGAGGRLTPLVEVGDAVMFGGKNIVANIESDSPPYAGHRVVIVSERNIICKLPKKIEWEPYA